MAKGISLHIGLNEVDAAHYGSTLPLAGCHNDAKDMCAIATTAGYHPTTLLDAEATTSRVVGELDAAARSLSAGDYFLLTFAGHGSQVADESGDEADGRDETWVLYDRLFLDDEIYSALARFAPGVRILLISDSCHSGTIARKAEYAELLNGRSASAPVFRTPDDPRFAEVAVAKHRELYARILRSVPGNPRDLVRADVIQISGCQDTQLSADGAGNGLFTSRLKTAWASGAFEGTHRKLWQVTAASMPVTQSPGYLTFGGTGLTEFENTRPFTIRERTGATTMSHDERYGRYESGDGNWAEWSSPGFVDT